MAGRDTSNGSASSDTEDSPWLRCAMIARRVGSARAAKTASRESARLTIWLSMPWDRALAQVRRRGLRRLGTGWGGEDHLPRGSRHVARLDADRERREGGRDRRRRQNRALLRD